MRWRVRVAGEAAIRPFRAAFEAFGAVRACGAAVARDHGITRGRQWRQLYAMQLRYGLGATSYYGFQLFRAERRKALHDYVDVTQYESVVRRYLGDRPDGEQRIFKDKRQFTLWARQHELPCVDARWTFDPAAPAAVEKAAAAFPFVDLFTKPADLASGKGAARWTYVEEGRWRGADGVVRDAVALAEELAARAATLQHPILVQEALRNHPDLRALSTGGLCTTRMVTARPRHEEPRLLFAIMRMPVGDAAVDNFSGGGIAATVEFATGRLGTGMRKYAGFLAAPVDRHPTTGTPIAGQLVPCWAEGAALVCRAHAAAPCSTPIVGWDLAFTDRGPVLVEGNNVPGIYLIQMPIDSPLGTTPLVAILLDYLRAAYGPA
jgi:hypothetical protein